MFVLVEYAVEAIASSYVEVVYFARTGASKVHSGSMFSAPVGFQKSTIYAER
jgi:hypothetical protein